MSDHKTYYEASLAKAQNELTVSDYINNFLNENPRTGTIVFEVHNDNPVRGRIPIPNAKITISKLLGDDYYLSKITTANENGETDPIQLPTVSRDLSLKPGEEGRVFSSYMASVEAPGYIRQDFYEIQIFDGITSTQHVNLQPVAQRGTPSAPAAPTGQIRR